MNTITNHEIVRQLDRILASHNFRHSSVLAKFLKHIVHETLEGRGHELKEYTIGVSALRKDVDFNPQIDSIVRIHAGRLRRALREYYQSAGAQDPISIQVPKGSYLPIFEVNAAGNFVESAKNTQETSVDGLTHGGNLDSHANRADGKPVLWVAPFKVVAGDGIQSQTSLTEYLSSELTRCDEIIVISSESEFQHLSRADYTLRGTIHFTPGRTRVFVYLNGRDGRQYWANTFDFPFDDLWKMEDEVVASTIAAIAGINGVILRVEMHQASRYALSNPQWLFSYWYKHHVDHFDPAKTIEARQFYESVLNRDPDNALAAAYLSEIICRQAFFEGDPEKITLLARALEISRGALLLDPTCQQAYYAMALVSMVLGRKEESITALEKGLAMNGKSVEFRAGAGAIYIYLGMYDRGYALLKEALVRLPDTTWVHLVSLSLYAFYVKDYKESLKWLDRAKVDTFWVLLVRAAAAINAEEHDIANSAVAEFRRKYNMNPADKAVIDDLFVLPEIAASIHTALTKISEAPLYVSERKGSRYSKSQRVN